MRDCRNGAEMKMDIFGDCQIYFSWVALKQILVDANFKFRKREKRNHRAVLATRTEDCGRLKSPVGDSRVGG